MSTTSSAITTPAVATTNSLKRQMASDKLRHLFPENAAVLALVATGGNAEANIVSKSGMIGKKQVMAPKFESFTYTPLTRVFTVASVTNATTYVLSSATGCVVRMTLLNTANNTVCRIAAISTATLTIVSVGGTAFSASAGDTFLALGMAYPENSSSPTVLQKTEDNLYNYTQIHRYVISVSNTAAKNPLYIGDRISMLRQTNMIEGKIKIDTSLLWGERASSGDTTTDSTLSESFRTTRGLWNWAGASYDAGGNLTPEKFRKDLIAAMNDTVRNGARYIMMGGKETKAIMLEWVQDKIMYIDKGQGKQDKAFIDVTKFITSGPTIEYIEHDSFNRGSNTSKAIIFNPEDVFYTYLRDRDIQMKYNIQSPSTDGVQDELFAEVGIGVQDGGNNITKVTNIF